MDLAIKRDGKNVEIIVTGNIKSIADGQAIKEAVTKVFRDDTQAHIKFCIKDSFIITSAIIGFFIKAIKVDKMLLHVSVGNEELYTMLSEMNLIEALNVMKD